MSLNRDSSGCFKEKNIDKRNHTFETISFFGLHGNTLIIPVL